MRSVSGLRKDLRKMRRSLGERLYTPSRWHTPSKIPESRIVVIESDPFTAGLNGQRRKPCVGHQVAAGVRLAAKVREDLPVPLARLNDHAMGLIKQDVAEPEHLIQAARLRKDLRVCGDADHPAQYLRGHTVTGVTVEHAVEPVPTYLMPGGIGAEGLH